MTTTRHRKAWSQKEGIGLATAVEAVCQEYGCHVALTGGLLYKQGDRKDCDLLFYRIRQVARIDRTGLLQALDSIGLVHREQGSPPSERGAWVVLRAYHGKPVDLFFPEPPGDV